MPLSLQEFTTHFTEGLKAVDDREPVFRSYDPGIGPHSEEKAIELVMEQLQDSRPDLYEDASPSPYPSSRRECDLVIPGQWAIEAKLARPYRDNGDVSPHWVKKVLSPYPDDYPGSRSAIGDCLKLSQSGFEERRAVMIIGYEHDPPEIEVSTAMEAFEVVARQVQDIALIPGARSQAKDLAHEVFEQATVYAWEIKD